MSGVKYRSKSNPKSAATTPGSTKKEPVVLVEGPRYSHYSWVARAVVITTVIVGVLYFIPKAQSRSKGISSHADTNDASHRMWHGEPETGLVFDLNTIFSDIPDIQPGDPSKVCKSAVHGNPRAETLKTWITSLSKTERLFIIGENPRPKWSKYQVEYTISMCMQVLELWAYFKVIYVWDPKENNMQNLIDNVIQETGLDIAKLRFICRSDGGDLVKFLEENKFNVFVVESLFEEKHFEAISHSIQTRQRSHSAFINN